MGQEQTLAERSASTIRAELARRRKTQAEAARQIGLTQQALSRRLRGKVSFSVTEIALLAEWLEVRPAVLLGDGEPAARSA